MHAQTIRAPPRRRSSRAMSHETGRASGAQQGKPYRPATRLAWEAFTE